MPVGRHRAIFHGEELYKNVSCDEAAFRRVSEFFASTYRDLWENAGLIGIEHSENESGEFEHLGRIVGFEWDPARGIIAIAHWNMLGVLAIRNGVFRKFSPCFSTHKTTGDVHCTLGAYLGGIANAPAFGDAMPDLLSIEPIILE
jgi:hypothetical protein